jgi:hypothetical protein
MMRQAIIVTAFAFALFLAGCSLASYSIKVVDGLPKEIYLTFTKGSPVQVGDIFTLYHLQQAPANASGHGGHGGSGTINLKHEIGKVQVVSIADETHALVKVLSGYVEDGVQAEKVE